MAQISYHPPLIFPPEFPIIKTSMYSKPAEPLPTPSQILKNM